MRSNRLTCLALFLITLLPAQPPAALFDGLRWRLIGPFCGGRQTVVFQKQ